MFGNYIIFCPSLPVPTIVNSKMQIGARICIQGSETFFPLDVFVSPSKWDLISSESTDDGVNGKLSKIKAAFLAVHGDFIKSGVFFTAKDVFQEMQNYADRTTIPADKMIAEIHAAVFATKGGKQPASAKKPLSLKKQIELDIKQKMAKRKLNILLDA